MGHGNIHSCPAIADAWFASTMLPTPMLFENPIAKEASPLSVSGLASLLPPRAVHHRSNQETLKVFESTYPEGFTWEQWDESVSHLLPCYAEEGAELGMLLRVA